MSPIGDMRRRKCVQCPTPCEPYLAGQIQHDDLETACPIGRWLGLGNVVIGQRAAPVTAPTFRIKMRKVGCGTCKPIVVAFTGHSS